MSFALRSLLVNSSSIWSSSTAAKALYSSQAAQAAAKYKNILTEIKGEKKNVALIQLNRPKALNALCAELMTELSEAVQKFDKDPSIACMVLTGSQRAFAAGADIKEMQNKTFSDVCMGNFLSNWTALAESKTPIIAAVNGFALGGGCELAMMCDIILAGEKAEFGQVWLTIIFYLHSMISFGQKLTIHYRIIYLRSGLI